MIRNTVVNSSRRGAIAPLTAILMVVLTGMVAFAVDLGYIAVARSEAQNAADSASLAGLAKLAERLKSAPIVLGIPVQTSEDLDLVRAEARAFASRNRIAAKYGELQDSDIEIGYMADPHNQDGSALDTTGWPARPYNAVRVTMARDKDHAGGRLNLFFAPVLGTTFVDVRANATAAFPMGAVKPRGNHDGKAGGILPFTYQVDEWNALLAASGPGPVTAANGTTLTLTDNYSVDSDSSGPTGVHSGADGKLETILYPSRTGDGNFGTINFSTTMASNSTGVLQDLIEYGPNEADWPDLPQIMAGSESVPVPLNGDPGLSAGIAAATQSVVGEPRIIPLYSTATQSGNVTTYNIVGFAAITITEVTFQGSNNSHITIQPCVISQYSSAAGANPIDFDMTADGTPNVFFLGVKALVR